MPSAHQRTQKVRELLAQLEDIVTFGFEQLEQRP
jgi:hypothetical protein